MVTRRAPKRGPTHGARLACASPSRAGHLLPPGRGGSIGTKRKSACGAARGGRCGGLPRFTPMRIARRERLRSACHVRFMSGHRGETSMPSIPHSREAEAAQRFFEATRNVELAFRAVRGDAEATAPSVEYAAAVSRLDRALDELARAQAWFDSAVRMRARKRN
ncbi:hypothetical protein [Burkholderia pseudomallei]|uniref:hypothetical protein n=1 Tax=Burkholderia pseudomallei TaxID=28450 RepID=UPI000A9BC1C3